MSDLRELYQSVILDHNKRPRNLRKPGRTNHSAAGFNPLCGDRVTVHLEVDESGVVRDVGFEGSGCAISTASASMMTEAVKGMTLAEVDALFDRFHHVITAGVTSEPSAEELDALGKLAVFAGVREYPARIKCATLVWHALRSAVAGGHEMVSTE
ncbi:MAG: SUF system NifU family Fe-S cluster assembly protein [Vicinamibacterales bacterium]|jgi:nitrogen fixation NifU-like protein|nr:SUF system NifU family Fe-S cluster assembly protein [Vicinamibacterales bacterium]